MNELQAFSEMSAREEDKAETIRQDWERKLPPIKAFIPDKDAPEGHGTAYFLLDTGILAVQRYSNGYDIHSQVLYDCELLDLFQKIRNGEVV